MGRDVFIPIMNADEEGEPADSMAKYEEFEDAEQACSEHPLCKTSRTMIIDGNTADGIFF